ncbi:Nucleotide-binding universal stress protein, UspA family [Reichenbachiella agariperforans]|uniref:Nucleotide-binding universal stress protein, UspA family n=1 Tax=Reichenbachiella agariperforans TaxID=156994 RepID=A0A1M6SLU0_REIAG|nr:universal stress protein [Reichenbachiella agariperforans]SHK45721.1 Nucleotide-binding universal stress protein, UspA family [Reichenbachiella agariperforans]
MKKILVPTDFSKLSEDALAFAIEVAQKYEATITLVTSLHYDFYPEIHDATIVTSTLLKKVEESSKEQMNQLIARYNVSGVSIDEYISDETLITILNEKITHEAYDLVIMGTSGSSGIDEFLEGSNTEKVVRKAACPVISISGKTVLDEIKRVMIPIDIDDIRMSFLQEVASMEALFNVQLDFVWVRTVHNIENEEEISRETSKLIQSLGIKAFTFHIVRSVSPSVGILRYVEEENIDMIAMATHARKGIAHWLLGSLTEDTVNHVKVPVWSFKMDSDEKRIDLDSVEPIMEVSSYTKIEMPVD